MTEMIYIPMKARIWDMKHIREYIIELDEWEGEDVSSSFPYLRRAIKLWDTEKKNIQEIVPGADRAMKGEITLLRQYIKKKDIEERVAGKKEKEYGGEIFKILEDIEDRLAAIEKLLREKRHGKSKGSRTSRRG